MRVCVLHRYPISVARETNPSLPGFLNNLISAGHEVVFVSLGGGNVSGVRGLIVHQIALTFDRTRSVDKLLKSLLFCAMAPLKVRRLDRQRQFDLVYCDDSFPLYGFLVKMIARTKTVIRLGDLQSGYVLARGFFRRNLIFPLVLAMEKRTWGYLDKVVVVSHAFEDFLVARGFARSKIDCVPECIDLKMFRPGTQGGSIRDRYGLHGVPVVVFHGLVARIKGVETLLRAVPEVLEDEPSVKFMIIGDGAELERLKSLADRLSIRRSVIFTGWVPLAEIPSYLADCDVGVPMRSKNIGNEFVVTSALLQYWAMTKPIVAPDLAAVREVVKHGRNGLLFRCDDPHRLARGILFALGRAADLRLGEHGRSTAESLFSADRIARRMTEVLLGQKGAAA